MNAEQIDNRVARLINPTVQGLKAYKVPKTEGAIKLDAMENPFPWPETMRSDWLQRLDSAELNRYPLPGADGVKDQLRQTMGIDDAYGILFGNGSDELIQIIAMAVNGGAGGNKILAPEPGFVMYGMVAKFLGMEYVGVPLTDEFELDLEVFLGEIEQQDPALIFLAQPNNPTGNLFGEEKIRRIIEQANGLVVIDEAYLAFTDSDLLPLLDDYSNVVVMRTLSKVGLAGLRLGMLIGHPRWLGEFDKVRLPYNISVLTQISAQFALEHYDVLAEQTEQLRVNRGAVLSQLQTDAAFKGIQVWPSEANFLLIRVDDAPEVHRALKEEGVLVKLLHGAHPLLSHCLRVNVSSEAENQAFLAAFAKVLA